MNDKKKEVLDKEIKEKEEELDTGIQDALLDDDGKTTFMLAMQNGATMEEASKMAKAQAKLNKIKEQNSLWFSIVSNAKEQAKVIIPIIIISSGSAIATWWDKIIDAIKN